MCKLAETITTDQMINPACRPTLIIYGKQYRIKLAIRCSLRHEGILDLSSGNIATRALTVRY
ncbi:MAG: hypothetical protein OEW58_08855 [Gammaproteobacteria bacterium]|nr:hypothetical protein [Gammaproteobacteria bacterium]